MMRHKSKIAVSLEDCPGLCDRILDFLGLIIVKTRSGMQIVVMKSSRYIVILGVKDKVDAVKHVLELDTLYGFKSNKECLFCVENPFYKKSLDEIKVMLDFGET